MKSAFKIVNLIFVLVILLSLTNLHAQAETQANIPDPNFKANAVHTGRSRLPYYGAKAVVEEYLSAGLYYSEDVVSGQIVEISSEDMPYKIDPTFSVKELKNQAEKLVGDFLGNKVKLNSLSYTLGKKIGTFFFHWEDTTKHLDDGTAAFIQVGLSHNGDFLNLVNTLPFAHDGPVSSVENTDGNKVSPGIGPFSEFYANGGKYWNVNGSNWHSATGGWYYFHPAGCSGAFCSKFYWSTISSCPICYVKGIWRPNPNTKTLAAAFIPSTRATASVRYLVMLGNRSSYIKVVDQNRLLNAWANLTPAKSESGVLMVTLDNFVGTAGYIAWDEIWVYNP
jgi:hypothetical protein